MRLCIVNLDYKPARTSGLAVFGERLAEGIAQRGHSVTVITARRTGLSALENQNGIAIHRLPIGKLDWPALGWLAPGAIHRLSDQQPFDRVHFLDIHFAFGYHQPFSAHVFQSFRQRLHADHGMPYHTSNLEIAYRVLYYHFAWHLLERPAVNRAKRIIAPSQTTADEFRAHYGVPAARMTVIPCGFDLDFFSRRPAEHLRQRLGLQNKFVALHVGFAAPRKGLEIAARALRHLDDDVVLVQVGQWNPRYRQKFHAGLANEQRRIIEVGYVTDDELPVYYSMADVAIFPSLLEGFGMPPVEAMACQTPVIVSDGGSLPEVVGDAGIIVPSSDALALADAIRRCRTDRRLALDMGRRGRERAEAQFALAVMVDRTLEVLSDTR